MGREGEGERQKGEREGGRETTNLWVVLALTDDHVLTSFCPFTSVLCPADKLPAHLGLCPSIWLHTSLTVYLQPHFRLALTVNPASHTPGQDWWGERSRGETPVNALKPERMWFVNQKTFCLPLCVAVCAFCPPEVLFALVSAGPSPSPNPCRTAWEFTTSSRQTSTSLP